MTPALYEVQFNPDHTEWMWLSRWIVPPNMLSRFLDYLFNLYNSSDDPDSKATIRVKRVPYQWGVAQWEFDYFPSRGYGHVACQH